LKAKKEKDEAEKAKAEKLKTEKEEVRLLWNDIKP
jgi:hypothetical protein